MSKTSLLPNVTPFAAPVLRRWSIDPIHSTVGFSVRHLMVANVRGVFEKLAGTIHYDPAHPEATRAQVTIQADSIHTREPQRDQHLRSADFLDAEHHPELTFRTTSARLQAGNLQLAGELTIRGTTCPITLDVTEIAEEHRDFQGKKRIGASARGKLRRSEFGITFNKVIEAGNLAIGDEVTLTLDVSLVEAEEPS